MSENKEAPSWIHVCGLREKGQITEKMRMPNGWLFRETIVRLEHLGKCYYPVAVSLAFVPDQPKR